MAKAKTTPRATADFARARSEAQLIAERDNANARASVANIEYKKLRDETQLLEKENARLTALARASVANIEYKKLRDETQLLEKENARLTALIEEHDRVRKFLSTEKIALRLSLQSFEQNAAKLELALATMAIEYSELKARHEERELSHKVDERRRMKECASPSNIKFDGLRYGIDRTAVRDTV